MPNDTSNLCLRCMRERDAAGGVCPYCGFDERAYSAAPHHLSPRSILNGRFLIGTVQGEGGFGITYLGYDLNLDLKVVIREYYIPGFVVRNSSVDGTVFAETKEKAERFGEGLERYINEARNLARFSTLPGLSHYREVFRANKTAYIIIEPVEGVILKEYICQSGGSLPEKQLLEMMRPLIGSLARLHEAEYINLEISPYNTLVREDGTAVLVMDIGSLYSFSDSKPMPILQPGYCPPEQYFRHVHKAPGIDVYALCATMYYTLTGTVPLESLERLQEDTLPPCRAQNPAISEQTSAALARGMAVRSEKRLQSMDELAALLYPDEGRRK